MKKRTTTKLLIVGVIAMIFSACGKDTYTTKPQITIKSINSTTIRTGDALIFQIHFTDKEGDIQDTLWVMKYSRVCPGTIGAQFPAPVGYKIPDFTGTSNLEGIIEVGFGYNAKIDPYQTIAGCGTKNDTTYFKFWLKDKAKNSSDTITSDNIALLK